MHVARREGAVALVYGLLPYAAGQYAARCEGFLCGDHHYGAVAGVGGGSGVWGAGGGGDQFRLGGGEGEGDAGGVCGGWVADLAEYRGRAVAEAGAYVVFRWGGAAHSESRGVECG